MENIEKLLTNWQLHPVVDHFSIALLVVAVVIDIVALIFSQRPSLRHTALTLMIIGAIAAAASYGTGDIEGDRVRDLVTNPAAKEVLKHHADLGGYLMIAFGVLALWRILIAALGFMERTHQIYLAFALLAVCVLLWQGKLGGDLVYTYQVGTGTMAAGAPKASAAEVPAATTSAVPAAPTAIPTVYVPTAAPTAAATEAPAAPSAAPSAATEKPASEGGPGKSPEPSGEPSAKPTV